VDFSGGKPEIRCGKNLAVSKFAIRSRPFRRDLPKELAGGDFFGGSDFIYQPLYINRKTTMKT
jgi:hypothetical protein